MLLSTYLRYRSPISMSRLSDGSTNGKRVPPCGWSTAICCLPMSSKIKDDDGTNELLLGQLCEDDDEETMLDDEIELIELELLGTGT